jgi:hypothetical protein
VREMNARFARHIDELHAEGVQLVWWMHHLCLWPTRRQPLSCGRLRRGRANQGPEKHQGKDSPPMRSQAAGSHQWRKSKILASFLRSPWALGSAMHHTVQCSARGKLSVILPNAFHEIGSRAVSRLGGFRMPVPACPAGRREAGAAGTRDNTQAYGLSHSDHIVS